MGQTNFTLLCCNLSDHKYVKSGQKHIYALDNVTYFWLLQWMNNLQDMFTQKLKLIIINPLCKCQPVVQQILQNKMSRSTDMGMLGQKDHIREIADNQTLKLGYGELTHWGRATHICVSKLTNIGSDNGLSPGRRQAIVWTNAWVLLIWPLETNFSEFLIENHTF